MPDPEERGHVADENIKPFQPLGNYDWPSTPVNRNIDRLKEIIKKRLFRRIKRPTPLTYGTNSCLSVT